MGRSVSTPSNASQVVYAHVDYDEDLGQEQFADDVDSLRDNLMAAFPSLYKEDKWIGREDHVIAANRFAYVGVSEYCGLLSIWVVERDECGPLGQAWCSNITKAFERAVNNTYGTLLKHVATASNGESFYQPTGA